MREDFISEFKERLAVPWVAKYDILVEKRNCRICLAFSVEDYYWNWPKSGYAKD